MKPVRKAVFPVAGLGTRFLPATKAIPKEMLTVVDRPLIQYAIEEAREAGIEQFIFVTGRGKGALEDHFDISFELEAVMRARQVARHPPVDSHIARERRFGSAAGAARPRPRRLVRPRHRRRRAVRGVPA
jgi:UTP-glucose-1-phosphate uridylyltransferase